MRTEKTAVKEPNPEFMTVSKIINIVNVRPNMDVCDQELCWLCHRICFQLDFIPCKDSGLTLSRRDLRGWGWGVSRSSDPSSSFHAQLWSSSPNGTGVTQSLAGKLAFQSARFQKSAYHKAHVVSASQTGWNKTECVRLQCMRLQLGSS